jgi:hypothetical protein
MGSWYLYFIFDRSQRGPVWYSFTYRPTACMMRTSRPCSRQQSFLPRTSVTVKRIVNDSTICRSEYACRSLSSQLDKSWYEDNCVQIQIKLNAYLHVVPLEALAS